MVMKLDAGEYKRVDEFLIDPGEIIVDHSLNSKWQPHTKEDVEARADSFESEGQLDPVLVRRVQGNKPQLVFGYCRHAACLVYNLRHPEAPMQLRCRVIVCNDEEAFRSNIAENNERVDPSPMDDAHSQRRLREQYGWDDKKIADFYGYSQSYVSTLAKLMLLPKKVQKQVHAKELSVATAVAVAELSPGEQEEVLGDVPEEESPLEKAANKDATGNVASSNEGTASNGANKKRAPSNKEVMKRTRDKLIEKGKSKGRSLAEVRAFLDGMATGEGKFKEAAQVLLRYIKGTIKDETAAEKLAELLS